MSVLISEFCIPCVKISLNEANCKNGVFLILIRVPGGTHAVKVWLNKSITQKSNLIENIIEKSAYEKLLGVNVDYNLKFNEHLESILKKAMRKVNALSRILPYRNFEKRRILMNSCFTSQFNYCSLVWKFHSCTINNKIKHLYKICLHVVYSVKISSFEKVLEMQISTNSYSKPADLYSRDFESK